MIARFFGKLAAVVFPPGWAGKGYTSWSIRVPCPGGRAASTVGCGVRVPSAAAPFCTSGTLGALVGVDWTGAGAETAETLISNILFVASDFGRIETNDV
jgi:hypothetical protein